MGWITSFRAGWKRALVNRADTHISKNEPEQWRETTSTTEVMAKGPVELHLVDYDSNHYLHLLVKESDLLLIDFATAPNYLVGKTIQDTGAIYSFAAISSDLPDGVAYVQIENLLPDQQDFEPFRQRLSEYLAKSVRACH